MRIVMDSAEHSRIFGTPSLEENEPGRSRKCRVCGDWHRLDKPWPHNCRTPAKPRNPDLSSPQLAPSFEPFKTGVTDTAEYIGSRNDKREYMRKNDLVEYESGVTNEKTWAEERAETLEIMQTMQDFKNTDTDYIAPDLKAIDMNEGGSLDDGTEIEVDGIEVAE